MRTIVNKTFDEIATGDTVSMQRTLQASDLRAWASILGDPDMLVGSGESQGAVGIITALLTALVGSGLPGPGSSILNTSVQLKGALPVGAPLTTRLLVREKRAGKGILLLEGECTDPAGAIVAMATLEVVAPTTRRERQLPEHRLDGLLERCRRLKPMLTGVVHPCSADALAGAVEAAEAGLIEPVLFGPETEIRRIANQATSTLPSVGSSPRTMQRTRPRKPPPLPVPARLRH